MDNTIIQTIFFGAILLLVGVSSLDFKKSQEVINKAKYEEPNLLQVQRPIDKRKHLIRKIRTNSFISLTKSVIRRELKNEIKTEDYDNEENG